MLVQVSSWMEGHPTATNKFGGPLAQLIWNGTFEFSLLPPGEYGIKSGHDAYEDLEVYPGELIRSHPSAFLKELA